MAGAEGTRGKMVREELEEVVRTIMQKLTHGNL